MTKLIVVHNDDDDDDDNEEDDGGAGEEKEEKRQDWDITTITRGKCVSLVRQHHGNDLILTQHNCINQQKPISSSESEGVSLCHTLRCLQAMQKGSLTQQPLNNTKRLIRHLCNTVTSD